jgi:hypothetical protein
LPGRIIAGGVTTSGPAGTDICDAASTVQLPNISVNLQGQAMLTFVPNGGLEMLSSYQFAAPVAVSPIPEASDAVLILIGLAALGAARIRASLFRARVVPS